MDATKETFADVRHRALRHHSQGIFEGERLFGLVIINSDGKSVPVRYVLEQHVREDCGDAARRQNGGRLRATAGAAHFFYFFKKKSALEQKTRLRPIFSK